MREQFNDFVGFGDSGASDERLPAIPGLTLDALMEQGFNEWDDVYPRAVQDLANAGEQLRTPDL